MHKKPLLIFDSDDTLIHQNNINEFFDQLLIDTFEYLGYPLPSEDKRLMLWHAGKDYPEVFNQFGVEDIHTFWTVFDGFDIQRRKKMVKEGKIQLIDGVRDSLEQLSTQGYPMAVLSNSNSPITKFLLKFLKIDRYFTIIQGLNPQKTPEECKPEIKGLQKLIKKLQQDHSISKNQADKGYFIGDSWSDVLTAVRADINAIYLVPSGDFKNAIPQKLHEIINEKRYNKLQFISEFSQLTNILCE